MLTFRALAAGSVASAQAMAAYLTEVRQIAERVGLSEYYAEKTGMVRADVDSAVAKLLALPLDRPLTESELANIIAGYRADGIDIEGAARQRSTDNVVRVSGYDLTFSAPKHLSIAIAFAPTESERRALDRCHTEAVAETMRYIESQAAWARRGKGGRGGSDEGRIAWITFEDYTARPVIMVPDGAATYMMSARVAGDMQRHTHVIVPAKILTYSGHVGSIHGRTAIGGRVHEYGKIYQAFLATKLRKLGAEAILDNETGMARIASVPRSAVELFSKRSVRGEHLARDWAAEHGLDWESLDPKQRIGFLKQANALSRRSKEGKYADGMPDKEIWERQAREAGYEHRSVLRPGQEQEPAPKAERLEAAYHTSLSRLDVQMQRRSKFQGTVARCAAVEGLIEHGIVEAGRDIYAITQAYRTEGVMQDGSPTALQWGRETVQDPETGEVTIARFASFTTDAHVTQEREAVALLRVAGNDRSGVLDRSEIESAAARVTARTGFRLSDPQMQAAIHLGTTGRAAALIGAAGTGKTALFEVLIDAWHAQGAGVVGVTRAWRQTQGLTEAGADKAHSVRQFVLAGGSYGPGHVVILDEVSQIGTRDLLKIARMREQQGFRLVVTGDHKQGGAVESGNAVRLFELALGEDRVPELTWTRRQETARDRETALMFRHGRAAEALERKDADGTLSIVPGGYREAINAAVDLWSARRTEHPERTIGISAPTNADAMAIGTEIRRRQQAAGEVGPDRVRLLAIDQRGVEYELPLSNGDQVRLFARTWGQFSSGRKALVGNNGSVVRVESLDENGMFLRTRRGLVAHVAWDDLRDAETKRIKLAYGHALTIDARQGDTVDEHFTVMPNGSRALHGLQAYVAASRHRMREWFVTSQGEEIADLQARRPLGDPRNAETDAGKVKVAVIENMARNLSRQPEKELATDFIAKANRMRLGLIRAMQAAWHREETREAAGKPKYTILQRLRRKRDEEVVREAVKVVQEQQKKVAEIVQTVTPATKPQAQPTQQPARSPAVRKLMSEAEIIADFASACENAGLVLEGPPVMDGKKHVVPVQGAKRGARKSGMYIGHLDDWPAGFIQNSKEGAVVRWKAGAPLQQSNEDREARRERIEAERKRAEIEKAVRDERVAGLAKAAWDKAMPAVKHDYLSKKDIGPHWMRQDRRGNLMVPMQDSEGKIWNIQSIWPDGTKLFGVSVKGDDGKMERLGGRKQGLYSVIGGIEPGKPIGIAEGFATAATVHELTKMPVAIAFDAGNIEPVAKTIRGQNADSKIVFFADNDHHLPRQSPPKPNVGVEKAHAAAREVGNAVVLAPRFEPHENSSDWNDAAARGGRPATKTLLTQGLAEVGIGKPVKPPSQSRDTGRGID